MIGRAILAVAVTAALTALGGGIGFAIGAGVGLVILTAREPTLRQQRDAIRGVVAVGLLRRIMRK